MFPIEVTRLAVTVNIPQAADIKWGDQAGVVLYLSETKWIKLVLEGDQDDKPRGSRMIVLAYMPANLDSVSQGGEPFFQACVHQKWELGSECPQSRRLQLELRRAGERCTLIASWDDNDVVEMDVPFEGARLGVMAHLNKEKTPFPREGWFHFSEFSGDRETAAAERVGR